MSSQSASSSVVTGVPLYTVINSSKYHLSSHQTGSRASCSPVMFMMNNSSSYVYLISGGCCSLQPKDQPVPKLDFSLESESESISEESARSSGISIFSCCKPQRNRGSPHCGH
ncbi:uncharacterized protein LOC143729551 isoform X2 [Siphateles boraxobius]|uniref:uncharacterized protein LOC143729551 isoform X2 n=1 Tax=Siphateles boraxobius TaxID=180520 RepID=UPI00406358A4